ncbi:hypothetical protein SCHPADRAFT_875707 [Schizopora paradoxa]|uniref:L domain-like protein n=1 Tax=Schizopora paradoxa TaxID=27342 RepID=A0A0H2RK50_9AGAM|nr:hypothetical protein SCHPADRAFT_875707 [Schizopora paradoxa]
MDHEAGDDYVRRIASFIRDNERKLAAAGLSRRHRSAPNLSIFNPLGWVGLAESAPENPIVLSIDTHHLFYLLMRLEAEGMNVGTLDVEVDNPSRPLSYIHLDVSNDKSETLSLSSFRSSFSAVSKLSIGTGWLGRPEVRQLDAELRFIFSSFTKLPALCLQPPGPKMIAELAQDPPGDSAIPLDSFKNLQRLECTDIDPRALLGWDRLAESLRSLTIKRSGLDDPSTIFIDAVLDDQLRRSGDASRQRTRKLGRNAARSFHISLLPETVREEDAEEDAPLAADEESPSSSALAGKLSPLKWAFLKHLCLADNAFTFFPTAMLSNLSSVSHLDLSSNLLVAIPSLSHLFNLVSLNLSDNMIDSVLGIYTKLGQVLTLNLSRNRLDSLCGLERLMALERVDLRHNVLEEIAEVGRLAVLPNIAEVWVEGNIFVEEQDNYRVQCFELFWKENKEITLDGSPPGFYERRNRKTLPSEQMYSSRPPSAVYSPPVLPVGAQPTQSVANAGVGSPLLSPPPSGPSSEAPSPSLVAQQAKPKRKRNKRLVALDNASSDIGYRSSEDGGRAEDEGQRSASSKSHNSSAPAPASPPSEEPTPIRRSRHNRYHTEFGPPSPPADIASSPPAGTLGRSTRRSGTLNSLSKRRMRVSASVFEPAHSAADDLNEGGHENQMKDSDAFRARIEALRAEMGDNWLQVLSQSQFRPGASPKP